MKPTIPFYRECRFAGRWLGGRPALAALVVVAALVYAAAARADSIRYDAKPGSKVTIAGTSTLHDWTMDGQIIGGHLELPADVTLDAPHAAGGVDANADASIPVRSLKSGHDGMDEVMQEAMDAKDHPRIEYHLTEMSLKEAHIADQSLVFDTKGELVVNGVTNVITMPVTIEKADNGRLKASGATDLKMTDFKVKPPAPTIGLGLIRTGDSVRITFEWLVGPPAKPAP
jgi:polyisoprenoid-binding protein YceI